MGDEAIDEAEGQIKKTHSKVLVEKKGCGKFRIGGGSLGQA